jgi:hypothetical protein
MCGSTAQVNATGASESYGYVWQSYFVECNDDFDKKCEMSVSINADFFTLSVHDDTLINMWNSINVRPSTRTLTKE